MEEGSFSLIFPPSFLAFIFISFAQITLCYFGLVIHVSEKLSLLLTLKVARYT